MLIRLLRIHSLRYQRPIAGLLILSLAGTMAALLLPSLNAAIIDQWRGPRGRHRIHLAYRSGLYARLSALIQVGCSIWASYSGRKNGDELRSGRPRVYLFERVLSFSSRELNHFGAPTLIITF